MIETILSAAQCSAPISTASKVSGASFNALKRKTNGMTEIAERFVVAMKVTALMIGVRRGLEIAVANQSRTGIEENLWRLGLKVKFQIRAIKTGPVLGMGVTVLLSGIGIKAVTQGDPSFKRPVQVETLARSSRSGEAEDLQA